MKIYNEVVIDIETGKTVYEDSYEYDGPMALCCIGGGGTTVVASTPEASPEEKAYYSKLTEMLGEEYTPTELETLTTDYLKSVLGDYEENKEMSQQVTQASYEYTLLQLDQYKQQIADYNEAKQLGELTGDLTEEELNAIDVMTQNATDKLISNVQSDQTDILASEISNMAAKGILNSNIATQAIDKITESATKAIAEGTATLESAKMNSILEIQQANKQRNLQLQSLVQQGLLGTQSAMGQAASSVSGYNTAALSNLTSTASNFAGLKTSWDTSKLNAAASSALGLTSARNQQATNALNASIASAQSASASQSGLFGALGNIAGLATLGAISKWR